MGIPPDLDPTDKEALEEHFLALAKGAADSIKWGRGHYEYKPRYTPLIYRAKRPPSLKQRRRWQKIRHKYLQHCGHLGGTARAKNLTTERMREIGRAAAEARWRGKLK